MIMSSKFDLYSRRHDLHFQWLLLCFMEATVTVYVGNVISLLYRTFCINMNYAYHINVKANYVPRLTEIRLSRKNSCVQWNSTSQIYKRTTK